MKQSLLFVVMAIAAIFMSSCSGDPVVGEWVPATYPTGAIIIRINSDGTAEYFMEVDDVIGRTYGTWTHVDGSDNKITIEYDEANSEIETDNPIIEIMFRGMIKESTNRTVTMIISEDGETLSMDSGEGYYIRY